MSMNGGQETVNGGQYAVYVVESSLVTTLERLGLAMRTLMM